MSVVKAGEVIKKDGAMRRQRVSVDVTDSNRTEAPIVAKATVGATRPGKFH